ncbi:hypothetical protein ACJX0J_027700, partial [Zea mays]
FFRVLDTTTFEVYIFFHILGLLDQRFMHRWNRLNKFAYLLAVIFSMNIFLEFCCCECALPTILGILSCEEKINLCVHRLNASLAELKTRVIFKLNFLQSTHFILVLSKHLIKKIMHKLWNDTFYSEDMAEHACEDRYANVDLVCALCDNGSKIIR